MLPARFHHSKTFSVHLVKI